MISTKKFLGAVTGCLVAAVLFVSTPAEAAAVDGPIPGQPEKCLPESVTVPSGQCAGFGSCSVILNYNGTGFADCEGCRITGTASVHCGDGIVSQTNISVTAACFGGQGQVSIPCPEGGTLGNVKLKCGQCR